MYKKLIRLLTKKKLEGGVRKEKKMGAKTRTNEKLK